MKAIGGLRGQVVALTTVVNEFAENQGAVKELAEVRVFRKVSALNNRSKKIILLKAAFLTETLGKICGFLFLSETVIRRTGGCPRAGPAWQRRDTLEQLR